MALHVLRKVAASTIAEYHDPEHGLDFLYLDKNKPWFEQRYLDCDHPRSDQVTKDIIANTEKFAVWADGEGVVATFDDFASAERARQSAKLTITTSFQIEDEAKASEFDAVESGAAAS